MSICRVALGGALREVGLHGGEFALQFPSKVG
jgi:hypothetical protein